MTGVYVLGQRFQHRRRSNFIDGVGLDAAVVADHLGRRPDPVQEPLDANSTAPPPDVAA